jgi:hypothetical protein
MVILSSPRVLESTRRIAVSPEALKDMNRQFLPMLRYHNSKLEISTMSADISEKQIDITFNDGSTKSISEDISFHEIAQRILDSDRDKTLEQLSS